MSKQITINIEDTMLINKEWLEKREQITEEYLNSDLILSHEVDGVNNLLHFIRIIKSQLFPSKVLVEQALYTGYGIGFNDSDIKERTQTFLTSPITINIEEDGK